MRTSRSDDQGIAKRLESQLDALVDEVYVVLGTAYLQFGARIFNEAWRRVHHANMQKERAQKSGDSKRDSTFDVIKPMGWTPPNHIDLVTDHAHVIYRHPGNLEQAASSAASDTRQI
jgi:predicted HAD superfamily Cof-like phosphohydrolase